MNLRLGQWEFPPGMASRNVQYNMHYSVQYNVQYSVQYNMK